MKKIKTIISEVPSGRVLGEGDSLITEMESGVLENCLPGDGSILEEVLARHPGAKLCEMTIVPETDADEIAFGDLLESGFALRSGTPYSGF